MMDTKMWSDKDGMWYETQIGLIHKILKRFAPYNKNRLHQLRLTFLDHCVNNKYEFNGLKVRGYLIDNLNGGHKYVISYFDKKKSARVSIIGPLTQAHFTFMKNKSFLGGVAINKRLVIGEIL